MTSSSGGFWPGPAQANGHRSNSSLCRRGKSPGVRIPATQVQRDRRSPGPIGDVSSGALGQWDSPQKPHSRAHCSTTRAVLARKSLHCTALNPPPSTKHCTFRGFNVW
jgi:hypothetical protein